MSNKLRYAMYPEAYKAGMLLSQVPTSTVGDFDVTGTGVRTRVNKDGLIEVVADNVPRLDYSDGGCPKLLTEVGSTNLITYSEDFSNVYWSKTNASVQGGFLSPNGDNSAFKYIPDNGQGSNRSMSKSLTSLTSKYTFSVYVKESGFRYVHLRTRNNPNRQMVFDFQTETFEVYNSGAFAEGTMKKVGDFYRISLTCDADESDTVGLLNFSISLSQDGSNSIDFNGNGVDGVIIANAQVEALPYATSYIPTNGSTEQRGADSVTNAGDSSTFNSESGVLFADVKSFGDIGNRSICMTKDNPNSISISFAGTSVKGLYFINGSGAGSSITDSYTNIYLNNKYALRYDGVNLEFFINGVSVGVVTSPSSFSSGEIKKINFARDTAGNGSFLGKTKSIQHWDYLTDEEMESLTGYQSYADMTSQFNFNTL